MITLSLSQLLKCSFSEVLLRSFYRLPRIGAFSRIVLQFKNDNIPARMFLQNLFYNKFGIWVTRVLKNNMCIPLCLKPSPLRRSKEGFRDTFSNKMQGSNRGLKPVSQDCHISQAKRLRVTARPLRLDLEHTKRTS